jgi:hypothetical protein
MPCSEPTTNQSQAAEAGPVEVGRERDAGREIDAARELEFFIQLMPEELVQQAARLMREQAEAYRRLTSACEQLTGSLVRGAPETISSLVRAGEGELLHMRARLVKIMSALTAYSDQRTQSHSAPAISADARAEFGMASNDLLAAARRFQGVRSRTAALATNGSNFTSACIEMCGVQPTTYRAPYQ